jgi:hypothetical protein
MATQPDSRGFAGPFLLLFNELLAEVSTVRAQLLKEPNSQAWRRIYVRSVFALVEAVISSMTHDIQRQEQEDCLPLSSGEQYSLSRRSIVVKPEPGHPTRYRRVSLTENIACVVDLYAYSADFSWSIDRTGIGWSDLLAAVKIRNRITHPTSVAAIEVSNDDVERVYRAAKWFHESIIGLFDETIRCLDAQADGIRSGLEREFGQQRCPTAGGAHPRHEPGDRE